MKLCLLVSRRCNLRCEFCQVEFTGKDMPVETGLLAVEKYLGWLAPGVKPKVKFFGGEPVLNWGLIQRLVEEGRARWAGAGLTFELATNGTFLDAEKISFLQVHSEVDVTVSQDIREGLPDAWYTLVLVQGTRAEDELLRMRRLLAAGYRRFNFLPAYFVVWSQSEIAQLRRTFAAMLRLIEGLRRAGLPIRVKNAEMWSPVPLYNDATTVDVDGLIYGSNMVQIQGMQKARRSLQLGSIFDLKSNPLAERPRPDVLEKLLREWAGTQAWRSTRRVDQTLTEFVRALPESR